jgi:MFS family permease
VTDPLLLRLAADFSVALGAAYWVVTVFAIGYGLNQLFFDPLGDRFGKNRVIAWAIPACFLTEIFH